MSKTGGERLITFQRRVEQVEQCQVRVREEDIGTDLFERTWLIHWYPVKVLDSSPPEIVKVEPVWIQNAT